MAIRPDLEMQEAMDEDLAALQKTNPKATVSDVVRGWSRMANRSRRLKALAQWQEQAKALAQHAQAASNEAEALRKQMAAYEAKEDAQRSKAIAGVLRVMRAPGNGHLRAILASLVAKERAGLAAETANFTLNRARREVGSWQTLAKLVGDA